MMNRISNTETIIITPKTSEGAIVDQTKTGTTVDVKSGSAVTNVDVKSGSAVTKKVTNKDIEEALLMTSGRKAVESLLEKSPLGMKKPDPKGMGYAIDDTPHYHLGTDYEEPAGGRICKCDSLGEDGSSSFTYKNDKDGTYTQVAVYDKDGNLKSTNITIRDDFGNIIEQYDCVVGDDGKMTIVH